MFNDSAYDCVGFKSTWKADLNKEQHETQTESCLTTDSHIGASETIDKEVQFNSSNTSTVELKTGSVATTRNMNSLITQELQINHPELQESLDSEEQEIKNIIIKPQGQDNRKVVSSISFNSGGYIIAVALMLNHQDWCSHIGEIELIKFEREDAMFGEPYNTLRSPACVSRVQFHPLFAFNLASATYSGIIIIWDVSVGTKIFQIEKHTNAITQIKWVKSEKTSETDMVLATSGSDGYIFMFKLNFQLEQFEMIKNFQFNTRSRSTKETQRTADIMMGLHLGITAFAFSDYYPAKFLVGMEDGKIFLCSVKSPRPNINVNLPDPAPIIEVYDKHQGTVTTIEYGHVIDRNELFLTAGTDNEIHIYTISKPVALKVIHSAFTILGIAPCPHNKVFCVWGLDGGIGTYDYMDEKNNVCSITNLAFTSGCYHPRRVNKMVLGNENGHYFLYSMTPL